MSSIQHRTSTRAPLTLWLTCAALASACSLTVPSESDLFGGGQGGKGGGGASGSAGVQSNGGASAAGMSAGGADTSGSGNSGPSAAGQAGEVDGTAGAADAAGAAGSAGSAGEPGTVELPPAVLFIHYDFDDLSQSIAKDSSGNGLDGTLSGASLPTGSAGRIAGALKLDGAQKQYVQLPNDILVDHPAVSVTAWIKLSQALAWDRVFDFNSGESDWFYFSPTGWNDSTKTFGSRCATRTTATLAPEIEMTETIPIAEWHHVAVVFAQPFLRYYLDGVLKSQQSDVPFGADSLGKTNQNWIGRSVYAADPYLSGLVDDFRLYTGALTAAQVAALAAQ